MDIVIRLFPVTSTSRMLCVEGGCGCFEVVVAFSGYIVTATTFWLLAACWEALSFSDVINSRLSEVITPSWLLFQ